MLKSPPASFSSNRNPQRTLRGYSSGFDSPAALLDSPFEHPEVSDSTAPLSKMPTLYCVTLSFSATYKDVPAATDKTNV
jgi:hypothetical protein